jgi:hypothetical protein
LEQKKQPLTKMILDERFVRQESAKYFSRNLYH